MYLHVVCCNEMQSLKYKLAVACVHAYTRTYMCVHVCMYMRMHTGLSRGLVMAWAHSTTASPMLSTPGKSWTSELVCVGNVLQFDFDQNYRLQDESVGHLSCLRIYFI